MIRKTLQLNNTYGLHIRAAAKFIKLASQYASEITLIYQDKSADGKSILRVTALGVPQYAEVELMVVGTDESEAFQILADLIENQFDEENKTDEEGE